MTRSRKVAFAWAVSLFLPLHFRPCSMAAPWKVGIILQCLAIGGLIAPVSKMDGACDLIDHTHPLLVYVLTVALATVVFGYIPAGLDTSVYIILTGASWPSSSSSANPRRGVKKRLRFMPTRSHRGGGCLSCTEKTPLFHSTLYETTLYLRNFTATSAPQHTPAFQFPL